MRSNPAKLAGRNPQPHREEVTPFEPEEVERIAAELGSTYGPLVLVAAYTGLRPSEWTALEWNDVDRTEGVLRVERAHSYGVLKSTKTKGSRRRVPLPTRAVEALEMVPRRLSTRLVFPGPRGNHIRPAELAQARVAAGRRGVRAVDTAAEGPAGTRPVPAAVRLAALVRRLEPGSRYPGPRPGSVHGLVAANDRPDLWAPCAGLGGGRTGTTGCAHERGRRGGRRRAHMNNAIASVMRGLRDLPEDVSGQLTAQRISGLVRPRARRQEAAVRR